MAQFLKDEIKEQIKSSGIKIFTEKGYQKASIKAIAEDAGVSVGNVYRYYKNKEDLYSQVIEGVYDGLHRIMLNERHRDFSLSPIPFENHLEILQERVIKPIEAFIKLYRKERLVFNMLLKGEKGQHYEQSIQYFIDLLKEHIFELWKKDGLVEVNRIEVSAFTNAIVFGVLDLLEQVDEEELQAHLIPFVIAMVNGFVYVKMGMEDQDEK